MLDGGIKPIKRSRIRKLYLTAKFEFLLMQHGKPSFHHNFVQIKHNILYRIIYELGL